MKRLLTAALALVLVFSLCACSREPLAIKTIYENIPKAQSHGEKLEGNTLVKVAENSSFSLSVNPENGQFEVVSLADGYVYSSCPAGIDEDTVSNDPVKNQARSVIKITFGDTINRITGDAVSYTDSVLSGGHSCFAYKDGFLSLYNFAASQITVPVLVTLDEQGIEAQVLTCDVEEKGDYILTDVSLLTHFGAGSMEEEGYIVVPDGSGAVIEFTNGKHEYPALNLTMYGADISVLDYAIENTRAYIPVYAIKRENRGFLAVIYKGDAHSTVNASVAGGANNYNNAYASFAVRDRAVVGISATSTGYANKNSILFDEREQALNSVGVKFILLGENNCDYTAMAKKYGEYLAKIYDLEKNTNNFTEFYLNTYCSVKLDKNIFGVKTTEEVSVFGFEEITRVLDELSDTGTDKISVFLNGWNASELEGDLKKEFAPFEKSGGEEGLSRLLEYSAQNDISVYGMADIFEIKTSNSLSARKINRKKLEYYPIALNTLKQDETRNSFSFISPAKLSVFCEAVIENSLNNKMGFGSALSKTVLYSDFGDNYSKRQQTAAYISELFENAAEKGLSLTAEQPAAYVVPYLDCAIYPGGAFAHYDIEDYQIPFYQLAISEYISYSGEPVNLSLDAEEAVMKTLEYGGGLLYSLIDKNGNVIFESNRSDLYNCEYSLLKSEVLSNSKELKEFYSKTGSVLLSHTRLSKDVYLSRYNNASAVFNYSEADYVYGDVTVSSHSFALVDEEVVTEDA